MKQIYVAHSRSFDYVKRLYQPLHGSGLTEQHHFILPHETKKYQNSKKIFQVSCDVVLAEITFDSTGVGIELGWAEMYHVPIFACYEFGSVPSQSALKIADFALEYMEVDELISEFSKYLAGPAVYKLPESQR